MIDRRTLTFGMGALAAATLVAPPALAQIEFFEPGVGPWTDSGLLRRAGGVLHHAQLGNLASTEPPVVLLHKLGGWMADWRHVAVLIGQTRRVIAFDLPGHGESQFDGNPPYVQTLAETASLIVGALTELGVGQFDLVGTSLGGCVSVPLAAAFPERVRNLALVSCYLGGGSGTRTMADMVEMAKKESTTYDSNGVPFPNDASLSAKIMGLAHPGPINAEQNASRRRAGRWVQPSERGVLMTDFLALLPRVSARTLLAYGARPNAYTSFRAGAEAVLKNSHTVEIPDSGAFAMQDNPAATGAALIKFLNA
jgi:pimeloyl-ACP methyl ester carboxylesterase